MTAIYLTRFKLLPHLSSLFFIRGVTAVHWQAMDVTHVEKV
jgi:hypothetical protein